MYVCISCTSWLCNSFCSTLYYKSIHAAMLPTKPILNIYFLLYTHGYVLFESQYAHAYLLFESH